MLWSSKPTVPNTWFPKASQFLRRIGIETTTICFKQFDRERRSETAKTTANSSRLSLKYFRALIVTEIFPKSTSTTVKTRVC